MRFEEETGSRVDRHFPFATDPISGLDASHSCLNTGTTGFGDNKASGGQAHDFSRGPPLNAVARGNRDRENGSLGSILDRYDFARNRSSLRLFGASGAASRIHRPFLQDFPPLQSDALAHSGFRTHRPVCRLLNPSIHHHPNIAVWKRSSLRIPRASTFLPVRSLGCVYAGLSSGTHSYASSSHRSPEGMGLRKGPLRTEGCPDHRPIRKASTPHGSFSLYRDALHSSIGFSVDTMPGSDP